MEIILFGAAKGVTGACFSISTKEEKILIDCGMFQGNKENIRMNYEDFGFNPKEYKALLLTHSHLDHCGRIPRLVNQGFRGKIYATNATKELAFIIMMDSAKLSFEDTEHENKRRMKEGLPPRKPIYNETDVKNAMKLFVDVKYDQDIIVTENILARFYDAGHILGASSIQLAIKDGREKKILAFSGDLGQSNSIIVKNAQPIKKADYVFMESTYGDRIHPPEEERQRELLRVINESYQRGGKLMIPSFAVERAQEILYSIGEFENAKLLPKENVYLDSPMAMKATKVFVKYAEYYNEDLRKSLARRENPFNFPGLIYTETVNESKKLNDIDQPCIIIAGNGMCTGGRIKHHIRNGINNPKNTLLFVGFQVEGTLGYWIKKGEKKIRLLGTEVEVKAKIESIEGFSAHADYIELLEWIDNFNPKPKKVFLFHGEESQAKALSKRIEKKDISTYIPNLREKIIL